MVAEEATVVARVLERQLDDPHASLPTAVLRALAKDTAQQLQGTLPEAWKWHGRNVFIADGSHVSMPDTPENQAGYPQPVVQEPGAGYEITGVVA